MTVRILMAGYEHRMLGVDARMTPLPNQARGNEQAVICLRTDTTEPSSDPQVIPGSARKRGWHEAFDNVISEGGTNLLAMLRNPKFLQQQIDFIQEQKRSLAAEGEYLRAEKMRLAKESRDLHADFADDLRALRLYEEDYDELKKAHEERKDKLSQDIDNIRQLQDSIQAEPETE